MHTYFDRRRLFLYFLQFFKILFAENKHILCLIIVLTKLKIVQVCFVLWHFLMSLTFAIYSHVSICLICGFMQHNYWLTCYRLLNCVRENTKFGFDFHSHQNMKRMVRTYVPYIYVVKNQMFLLPAFSRFAKMCCKQQNFPGWIAIGKNIFDLVLCGI